MSSPSRPTDDDIEAIIQLATSSRPSPDGRHGPPRDTRTQLFVGNLPYRVRWQDLKDLFRKAGTVLRADVSLGPDNRSRGYGTVLLATAEDAGRAVDMYHGWEWMGRILEVRLDRVIGTDLPDQSLLDPVTSDRPIFPDRPATSDGSSDLRSLFVGNLPFHVQWQDLKDLFRLACIPTQNQINHHLLSPASHLSHLDLSQTPHPPLNPNAVVRADVALTPDGRSRGFGVVIMRGEREAERARLMFDGYEYNGRTLKVHYDKFPQLASQTFLDPGSASATALSPTLALNHNSTPASTTLSNPININTSLNLAPTLSPHPSIGHGTPLNRLDSPLPLGTTSLGMALGLGYAKGGLGLGLGMGLGSLGPGPPPATATTALDFNAAMNMPSSSLSPTTATVLRHQNHNHTTTSSPVAGSMSSAGLGMSISRPVAVPTSTSTSTPMSMTGSTALPPSLTLSASTPTPTSTSASASASTSASVSASLSASAKGTPSSSPELMSPVLTPSGVAASGTGVGAMGTIKSRLSLLSTFPAVVHPHPQQQTQTQTQGHTARSPANSVSRSVSTSAAAVSSTDLDFSGYGNVGSLYSAVYRQQQQERGRSLEQVLQSQSRQQAVQRYEYEYGYGCGYQQEPRSPPSSNSGVSGGTSLLGGRRTGSNEGSMPSLDQMPGSSGGGLMDRRFSVSSGGGEVWVREFEREREEGEPQREPDRGEEARKEGRVWMEQSLHGGQDEREQGGLDVDGSLQSLAVSNGTRREYGRDAEAEAGAARGRESQSPASAGASLAGVSSVAVDMSSRTTGSPGGNVEGAVVQQGGEESALTPAGDGGEERRGGRRTTSESAMMRVGQQEVPRPIQHSQSQPLPSQTQSQNPPQTQTQNQPSGSGPDPNQPPRRSVSSAHRHHANRHQHVRSLSQTHTQQHPHHPGPIALPPPPSVSAFPIPMYGAHPISPHAMGMPLAHPTTAACVAGGGMASGNGHAVPMQSSAHGQGQNQGHAQAHGHPTTMVPMTPHGLPPITPSMPPFTFLPQPLSPMGGHGPGHGHGHGHGHGMHQHQMGYGMHALHQDTGSPGVQYPPMPLNLSLNMNVAMGMGIGMGVPMSPTSGTFTPTTLGPSSPSYAHPYPPPPPHVHAGVHPHPHASASVQAQARQAAAQGQGPGGYHGPTHVPGHGTGTVLSPFSPGVAMSPGSVYGAAGNPYINPAVGAPVHVAAAQHSPGWYGMGMGMGMGMGPGSMSPGDGMGMGMEPAGYFDTVFYAGRGPVYGAGADVESEILRERRVEVEVQAKEAEYREGQEEGTPTEAEAESSHGNENGRRMRRHSSSAWRGGDVEAKTKGVDGVDERGEEEAGVQPQTHPLSPKRRALPLVQRSESEPVPAGSPSDGGYESAKESEQGVGIRDTNDSGRAKEIKGGIVRAETQ